MQHCPFFSLESHCLLPFPANEIDYTVSISTDQPPSYIQVVAEILWRWNAFSRNTTHVVQMQPSCQDVTGSSRVWVQIYERCPYSSDLRLHLGNWENYTELNNFSHWLTQIKCLTDFFLCCLLRCFSGFLWGKTNQQTKKTQEFDQVGKQSNSNLCYNYFSSNSSSSFPVRKQFPVSSPSSVKAEFCWVIKIHFKSCSASCSPPCQPCLQPSQAHGH